MREIVCSIIFAQMFLLDRSVHAHMFRLVAPAVHWAFSDTIADTCIADASTAHVSRQAKVLSSWAASCHKTLGVRRGTPAATWPTVAASRCSQLLRPRPQRWRRGCPWADVRLALHLLFLLIAPRYHWRASAVVTVGCEGSCDAPHRDVDRQGLALCRLTQMVDP